MDSKVDTLIKLIKYDKDFRQDDFSMEQYRSITNKRMEKIIFNKIINVHYIYENPEYFLEIMNILHEYDLSLAVKIGVNFGLFGTGLLNLGNPNDVNIYVDLLIKGKIKGCLAMTEIGHGSNLKLLETVVLSNSSTDIMLLNSPTNTSIKCWIGNVLVASYAIVFANLIHNDVNMGLHPFLVKLRDSNGVMPGIKICDLGQKKGLNGLDNGTIQFRNVKLLRSSILKKYGYVDNNGDYVDCGMDDRFSELLSTLTGGRFTLSSGANTIAKKALSIAINYSMARKQFGIPNQPETQLINYQTHYIKLVTLATKTIIYDKIIPYIVNISIDKYEDNNMLSSLLKILMSEHAEISCRYSSILCGGNGYLMKNELCKLHNDIFAWQTFEGDNNVLRQEMCKNILKIMFTDDVTNFGKMLQILKKKLIINLNSIQYTIGGTEDIGTPDNMCIILGYIELRLKINLVENILKDVLIKKLHPVASWNEQLVNIMNISNVYMDKKITKILANTYIGTSVNYDFITIYICTLIKKYSFYLLNYNIISIGQIKNMYRLHIKLCKHYTKSNILHCILSSLTTINIPTIENIPMIKLQSKL